MTMNTKGSVFAIFLGALAALPPIATDMALPALTQIGDALHSSQSMAGLTLSLFMAGFAFSPFFYGPLSDRHGRRPLLLIGLCLFTLGGLLATLTPNMTILLAARLLQGLGAGAGMTLAMAMVRDSFTGQLVHSRLAVITIVANVAPIVAPALGAVVLGSWGWRGIYAATACSGIILLLMAWPGLPETARLQAVATRAGSLLDDYRQVLGHRSTVSHILLNALGFAWMFGYVAGSPLVLIGQLNVSPGLYTALFACTGAGIVAGATLSGWLGKRGVRSMNLMLVAVAVALLATLAASGLAISHAARVATLMPLLVLATAAFGMLAPCAAHGALDPLPELAGVTGGLLTSIQMLGGALSSLLVSLLVPHFGILGMTATMAGLALLSMCLLLSLTRTSASAVAALEH